MRPIYAVVCDHASAGEVGKINLIGIFASAGAVSFPAMMAPFSVSFQLEPADEIEAAAALNTRCHVIGPNKKEIFYMDASGLLAKKSEIPGRPRHNLIYNMIGFVVTDEGDYTFDLRMGGKSIAKTYLHVYTIK